MRQVNLYRTICLAIILTFFCRPLGVYADVYIFPTTPDSPGWEDLTLEERIEAQQIPTDFLNTMTATDMYLTFLTMPSRHEYLFDSSSLQHGFDRMMERYNLLPELFDKADVKDILIPYYHSYKIDETNYQDCQYQEDYIALTALLLNQYEIITQTSHEEKLALVEKALSNEQMRDAFSSSCVDAIHDNILMGRIMYADEFVQLMQRIAQEPELRLRLDSGLGSPVFLELAPDYINYVAVQERKVSEFMLSPPSPNPFNPTATITYTLPTPAPVMLSVFSITGQKVATLVDEPMAAGTHSALFDGSRLSSGLYFARLESDGMMRTQKMLLVK